MGRARIHTCLLSDSSAHWGSSSSSAPVSWRSTQDIRSKEAGLACVGGGSSMYQTRLFDSEGREISPNLQLTVVTKEFLFPRLQFPHRCRK